jgi:uncharacterized protein (DUF305 family)
MKKTVIALLASNLLTASLFLTLSRIEAHTQIKRSGVTMSQCKQMMMQKLGKMDKTYDLRFINEMIPHHEGAVLMAKDAQKNAQHPEIKTLAHNIIDSQEKEIAQMKAWRSAWYGK